MNNFGGTSQLFGVQGSGVRVRVALEFEVSGFIANPKPCHLTP